MKFEYDEKKSLINKQKHGIDFVEAQKLWQDEDALVIPANIVIMKFAMLSSQKHSQNALL